MGIVKGKKLMVWVETSSNVYKSIGYATNHTLSTSASQIDVSHKDLADAGSGSWVDQDIDQLSWSITTENFYANSAEGVTFADLWTLYAAGTTLKVKFGVAADSASGVPTSGWSVPASGFVLSGSAVISSIDINAPVDDNASFSITFTGKGALTGTTLV